MNKLTDKFVSAIFNCFFQGQTSDDDELSQAASTKQFCFKFVHFKSSSVHTSVILDPSNRLPIAFYEASIENIFHPQFFIFVNLLS